MAEALGYLLADESTKVVKRVIQAANNLISVAFVDATSHPRARYAKVGRLRGSGSLSGDCCVFLFQIVAPGTVDLLFFPHTSQDMWVAVTNLANLVLNMRGSSKDGDRLQAYKCMEAMILLYSYRTSGAQNRNRDPSLDLVPVGHPFIDVRQPSGLHLISSVTRAMSIFLQSWHFVLFCHLHITLVVAQAKDRGPLALQYTGGGAWRQRNVDFCADHYHWRPCDRGSPGVEGSVFVFLAERLREKCLLRYCPFLAAHVHATSGISAERLARATTVATQSESRIDSNVRKLDFHRCIYAMLAALTHETLPSSSPL